LTVRPAAYSENPPARWADSGVAEDAQGRKIERVFEPFPELHAHTSTGELPIQFYGSAAERTYSALAALLF